MAFDEAKSVKAVEDLLLSLGLDIKDANFKDTPARVFRAYLEMFDGLIDLDKKTACLLRTSFPSTYSGIVTQSPIRCFSMCPHHFLPVAYTVLIGYMAHKKAIGLSKLARLAVLLAKRPVLQETYTEDLCDCLFRGLKAKGVIVVVKGEHLCMEMRGVKKEALTTTSSVRGCFLDPGIKNEFFSLVTNK